MYRFFLFFIAVVASVSFAASPKCNYDRQILDFEKFVGIQDVMNGAGVRTEPVDFEPKWTMVRKNSNLIKSGKNAGLYINEDVTFNGCSIQSANIYLENPRTYKTESEASAHFRKDGSIQAFCEGGGYITRENTWSGKIEANPNCKCYDANGKERSPGEFGCAEGDEIDYIKEHNAQIAK